MSQRVEAEQENLGFAVESFLKVYPVERLREMRDDLKEELREKQPHLANLLNTLIKAAPGSDAAAFSALLAIIPAHSIYRPKLKHLRVLARYIAARECIYGRTTPEPLEPVSTGLQSALPIETAYDPPVEPAPEPATPPSAEPQTTTP